MAYGIPKDLPSQVGEAVSDFVETMNGLGFAARTLEVIFTREGNAQVVIQLFRGVVKEK